MQRHAPTRLSRRRLLNRALGCGGLAAAQALAPEAFQLQLLRSARAAAGAADYRAIVCVFLLGGNDSYNMVIPRDQAHAGYRRLRGKLAINREQLRPLSLRGAGGAQFGLHPAMKALRPLFDRGRASVLANIGTLTAPTSRADYEHGSRKLPLNVHSHADQQLHWQSALPQLRTSPSGWMGRMRELIGDSANLVPQDISIAGNNLLQTSGHIAPFTASVRGGSLLQPGDDTLPRLRRRFAARLFSGDHSNHLAGHFAATSTRAVDHNKTFTRALANGDLGIARFPAGRLGSQLAAVARTISQRSRLGATAQTFYVTLGGWDMHGSLARHDELLRELADSLAAFQRSMAALGVEDQVVTYTASDFGRKLQPNSNGGTDHGWGGNHLVLGGGIRGNRLFGRYPELDKGAPMVVRNGTLPDTATDELYAELALWFGAKRGDLATILPNLSRFHDVAGGGLPLGLFA